jgi:hypothetical protein
MNQLLDESENISILKKTFSKLSFATSIITAILMLYIMTKIPSEIKVNDIGKPFISPLFAMLMLLFCALGFIFTILSFVKKEPTTLIKWVGTVINMILILVLIWSIFL